MHWLRLSVVAVSLLWLGAQPSAAQEPAPDAAQPAAEGDAAIAAQPERAGDAGVSDPNELTDAAQPEETDAAQPEETDASAPAEEPPRGEEPVSVEAVLNPDVAPTAPAQAPEPDKPAEPEPPPAKAPSPSRPRPEPERQPAHELERAAPVTPPAPTGPMIAWAAANWSGALGPGRCGPRGLEGADNAVKLASTMKRSVKAAGLAIAPAGALADHPVLAHAAKHQPEQLARLLSHAGFSAIVVGVSDMSGPLLREPRLSQALRRRGIWVIASNLECRHQEFCESWYTAEDETPILVREGRRYAVIGLLPDDLPGRVEPAAGRSFELRPAADTLVERTERARAAGAELILASIDHGPDATASARVANFLAELPPDIRPDLLFSPSSADSLLLLRPLDVQPAVVGTRAGVLTGLRVTKLEGSSDADVFARGVRLSDADPALRARIARLGDDYCRAKGGELPGGRLAAPMTSADLVELAANSARELSGADLALVDPLAYFGGFTQSKPVRLQRGQMERAVVFDSPLVSASVTLDWLGNLKKQLDGVRPLALIGIGQDDGAELIAGRSPVVGAKYTIVTSAVLARSGRLPDGAEWRPLQRSDATLRGALLAHLAEGSAKDPRTTVRDPTEGTQWVLRVDGQIAASLTTVDVPDDDPYVEPALLVDESRQLGVRLVLNYDADAPAFLFENALQIAFDRNFETQNTAQDLAFLQTTYTYRGLWPRPLLYPHPFVEGYVETEFEQGGAQHRHLLLRPKAGLRSMLSRVLSFKLSAGFQYLALAPDAKIYPGLGAELVLRPWTATLQNGTLQLEGNVTYYWNSPGLEDQHTLRGQLISAITLWGPLQFTLTALAALQKFPEVDTGKSFSIQAGMRVRFVDRSLSD